MFGIFSLRTDSCCCGISLRTGTIIILVFRVIASLSSIFTKDETGLGSYVKVIYVVMIIAAIAALCGVFKRAPGFMIPHLVIHAASLIIFLVFIICCILFVPFASKFIQDVIQQANETKNQQNAMDLSHYVYGLIVLMFIIFELIDFHFFKVILSYYYELQTSDADSPGTDFTV